MTDADPLHASIASYDVHARRFRDRKKDRSFSDDVMDAFAAVLPAGAAVADAGCGPGYDSPRLAARGLRVVSLDLSRGMLELARTENPGRCVRADLRHLPVRDGGLRGIWSMASLVHLSFDDAEQALHAFRAALSDGGALYVMVKNERCEAGTGRPEDEPDPGGRGFGGWRGGYDGPEDIRWFGFWNEPAFDAALAAAGFHTLGASTDDVWIRRLAVAEPVAEPDPAATWRIRVVVDPVATDAIRAGAAMQLWAVKSPANDAATLGALRATDAAALDPTSFSSFEPAPSASPEQAVIDVLETVDDHLADHRRRADRDDWTDVLEVRGARLSAAVRERLRAAGYDRFRPDCDGFTAFRSPAPPAA